VGDATLTVICIGSNQHEGRRAMRDINDTGLSGAWEVSAKWINMPRRKIN